MSDLLRFVQVRSGRIVATVFLIGASLGWSGCSEGEVFDPDRAVHLAFSGEQALDHVKQQVVIGPRIPGSKNLEKTRQYLERELTGTGWDVERQVFQQLTPFGIVEFVNLRARFAAKPESGQKLSEKKHAQIWERPVIGLVTSHYDTKKFNAFEFVGANDPGSSVGILLEMARVLAERPEVAGKLELVFFDGEEAFVDYSDTDGLYGSRYYAESLGRWPEKSRPKWGVLLDMVGDRDLAIRVPEDSPTTLVAFLFAAAEDIDLRKYFGYGSQMITDDHIPLNEAGIPTINIIDMDYGFWHTPGDTVDKLSTESLEVVGRVTLLMIEKYLLDKSDL